MFNLQLWARQLEGVCSCTDGTQPVTAADSQLHGKLNSSLCIARVTPRPEGWATPGFDDSRWAYALEYSVESVGYGPLPAGCEDPNTYISRDTDTDGVNFTCQNNINWGDSKFIWRPDLDLDNYVLCRYTLVLEDSRAFSVLPSVVLIGTLLFTIWKFIF